MGLLRQDLKRLTPERAEELKERLGALLEEFDGDAEGAAGDAARPFGLLVGLYPIESREERTDG